MNVKTVLVLLFSTCLGGSFLSSCSDDDPVSAPKDNSWYWGYFKGTIKGTEYDLENEPHGDTPIFTMKTAIHTPAEQPSDFIKGMITAIHYGKDRVLGVTLYPLYKSVHHIDQPPMGDWNEDGVNIRITVGSEDIVYVPKKEEPFRVEVVSLAYVDPSHPVLEAKVDGTLYNRDNPLDSIVVSGEYGTR